MTIALPIPAKDRDRLLRRLAAFAGLSLLLTGCMTFEPVQKGYMGATASLADSSTSDGGRCASFFFLEAYDGDDVENDLSVTERRNQGQGFGMKIENYSRLVPAEE